MYENSALREIYSYNTYFLKNKNSDNFIVTNNFYLVCAYVCVIPQYQE